MKAERFEQVSPIFRHAVELPPDERAACLEAACAGDAELRHIVFTSERTGVPAGWRMDIDGGNPKQLTSGGVAAGAEWVVSSSRQSLWKAPIDGGEPVLISEERLVRCAASHDGKMVSCSLETPGSPARLAVLPIEGGSPLKVFDVKFDLPARMRWTPDGRAVTYIGRQDRLTDIWSQPIDVGEPKRITNFKSDQIFSFDWSRDNKLVISHGSSANDFVLIKNIKQ